MVRRHRKRGKGGRVVGRKKPAGFCHARGKTGGIIRDERQPWIGLASGDDAVEIPDEAVDDGGVSDDDTGFDVPGLSGGCDSGA